MSLRTFIYDSRGLFVQDDPDSVVVPGYCGDIGVMAGDRVMLYVLRYGVLYLFKNNSVYKRYYIHGGSFFTKANILNIVANHGVMDIDNLDQKAFIECGKLYEDIALRSKDPFVKNYYLHEAKKVSDVLDAISHSAY